jgi:hypothetical protein
MLSFSGTTVQVKQMSVNETTVTRLCREDCETSQKVEEARAVR